MVTEARHHSGESAFAAELVPLYPLALGDDWNSLDASLRRFHGVVATRHAAGTFNVKHGCNRGARRVARILRLPAAGLGVPVHLAIRCEPRQHLPHGLVEIWERNFCGCTLTSHDWIDSAGLLVERFGLLELSLRLHVQNGALCFSGIRVSVVVGRLRLRLPRWLAPIVDARTSGVSSPEGGFAVSVKLSHPMFGLLLAYEGWVVTAA